MGPALHVHIMSAETLPDELGRTLQVGLRQLRSELWPFCASVTQGCSYGATLG